MAKRSRIVAGVAAGIGYFGFALAAGIDPWKAAGIVAVAAVACAMYASVCDDYLATLAKAREADGQPGATALAWIVRSAGAACVLFLVLILTAWALG